MRVSRDDGNATDADTSLSDSPEALHAGYRVGLFVAQLLGLVGIVLYNWWVWVIVATTCSSAPTSSSAT